MEHDPKTATTFYGPLEVSPEAHMDRFAAFLASHRRRLEKRYAAVDAALCILRNRLILGDGPELARSEATRYLVRRTDLPTENIHAVVGELFCQVMAEGSVGRRPATSGRVDATTQVRRRESDSGA